MQAPILRTSWTSLRLAGVNLDLAWRGRPLRILSLVSMRTPPRLISRAVGWVSGRIGTGTVAPGVTVAIYVISPHGCADVVSLAGVDCAVSSSWSLLSAATSGCCGGVSWSTSWGSRNDGFSRAAAATATDKFDASGDDAVAGSSACNLSSAEKSSVAPGGASPRS